MYNVKDILDCSETGDVTRHWLYLTQTGVVPSLSDMDPVHFPKALPHISLFKYNPEDDDYYCRLAGEDVSNAHSIRMKGKNLSVLYPDEQFKTIRMHWNSVRSRKEALVVSCELHHSVKIIPSLHVILPLKEDESDELVMSISVYRYDVDYFHNDDVSRSYKYTYITDEIRQSLLNS
ncbi:PAS domain-containing protein [Kiloniella laminariae]|uniref:PAS domain-containing protein n=1 Tax=Kiloniella laminariae TaxID=454162 RepID=A0ABT4LMH2_9PROT|nr:PAS domain-containing protein [Kiloniella laminariae]MCZ4282090.1 PAS domain-containing protein [Kiloniella laminariae]